MSNLSILEFNNQRIVTTKLLADEFGSSEKNIQDNFSNNKSRFTEGKHYYKLEGQALKDFKNSLPDNIGEPLKFAPSLILWTEKGAARHAKILDTDEAWEVYEELEETYFRVKESPKQLSAMEQLRLQYQVIETHEERLETLEQKFDSLEINPHQRKVIQNLKHKRVCELLSGNKTAAYKDTSFRSKVYSEMGRAYNNYFDIPSYELTPKNRFNEALEVVKSYNLSTDLAMELKKINNQVSF